jgi:hypothetical protein
LAGFPPGTRWDDLRGSRTFRAAWSTAVAGLLVAHVVISLPSRPTGPSHQRSIEITDRAQREALRDDLALPTVTVSPRALARVMGPSNDNTTNDADASSGKPRKGEVS